MAAFDRISCGIPQLDTVFDNIRLGDNVVWQLSSLDNFPTFVEPFVTQCLADKRPIIYMRFASHEPLVKSQPGVTIYELNPHKGFEAFTIEVRELITKEGREACYVFDCLSELQAAWSADLMMGNFFRVTCPYLFELDTVAYFPIIRGGHSFQTERNFQCRECRQWCSRLRMYENRPKSAKYRVQALQNGCGRFRAST